MMHIRRETIVDGVELILGDAAEVLPTVKFGSIVTDPPYGINYRVNARSRQNEGLTALKPWEMEAVAPIYGDDTPFDPSHLLGTAKIAIFGANHMVGLPTGGRWIIWDKRRESNPDDHSDCELVWTNVPGADRIHRQKWRGIVREGEENCSRSRKLHRNQKPVALLDYIFSQIGISAGETVCDPYMGSGSTGVVAIRRGNPFVGVEIDPVHFETACRRLSAELALRDAA